VGKGTGMREKALYLAQNPQTVEMTVPIIFIKREDGRMR
jgi:hypothetical protein